MGTVRDYEGRMALSWKKQSAYGTAVLDADLIKALRMTSFPDADFKPDTVNDEEAFGKGHEWATEQNIDRFNTALKTDFDLTSHSAGFLFAFLFGDVVSTQQGVSDAYSHVITPMSIATTKQIYVTSMVQQLSSGFKKLLRDLALNEVSLSCSVKDRAKITGSWIGSGYFGESALASMPTLIDSPYLKSDNLQFKLGTKGSEVDRSMDLTNFELTFSNDLLGDDGYRFDGDGYRRECEIGKRKMTLKFGLRLAHDSDAEHDNLMNQTPLSAIFDFVSPTMVDDTYPHSCKIEIPNFQYTAAPIKVDGKVVGHDIEVLPMYDAVLAGAVQVTVVNDVPADTYLTASV